MSDPSAFWGFGMRIEGYCRGGSLLTMNALIQRDSRVTTKDMFVLAYEYLKKKLRYKRET